MSAKVALTRGYVALVDEGDYELVSRFKWHACIRVRRDGILCVYARRSIKRGTVSMHTEISGYKQTDHKDGNGLNNQRSNLRSATKSQNGANSKNRPGKSSLFRGVYFHARTKKWCARVFLNGNAEYLGEFREEVDAATAYNFRALDAFGEFARLNQPTLLWDLKDRSRPQ